MSIDICRFLCDLLLSVFGEGELSPRRALCECFCYRAGTGDRRHRDGDALHVPGRLGGECGFRRGEQSHRSGADADRISDL